MKQAREDTEDAQDGVMCSASQDRSTAEPGFEPRSSVPKFWVPALDFGCVGEAMGQECGIWGPRALVSDPLYSLPVLFKQAFFLSFFLPSFLSTILSLSFHAGKTEMILAISQDCCEVSMK